MQANQPFSFSEDDYDNREENVNIRYAQLMGMDMAFQPKLSTTREKLVTFQDISRSVDASILKLNKSTSSNVSDKHTHKNGLTLNV